MPDDSAIPGFDEDPRIDAMVRKAGNIVELVLNAEFLLDEYVTIFLKRAQPGAYARLRQLGMTPEQKFHVLMGCAYVFDVEDMGEEKTAMAFLREMYRVRAKVGSLPEDRLLQELSAAYVRIGGDEAQMHLSTSRDVAFSLSFILASYLECTRDWMIYDPAADNEDSAFVEPLDTGEESGDPGWEPREQGGSCNFRIGDP